MTKKNTMSAEGYERAMAAVIQWISESDDPDASGQREVLAGLAAEYAELVK